MDFTVTNVTPALERVLRLAVELTSKELVQFTSEEKVIAAMLLQDERKDYGAMILKNAGFKLIGHGDGLVAIHDPDPKEDWIKGHHYHCKDCGSQMIYICRINWRAKEGACAFGVCRSCGVGLIETEHLPQKWIIIAQ